MVTALDRFLRRPKAPVQAVAQRVSEAVRPLHESRTVLAYNGFAELAKRHRDPGRGLTASEFKVFSQNGEDGVIAAIFERIGAKSRHFVEFGIGTGVEGNCVFLAQVLGWAGLFIESSGSDFRALSQLYGSTAGVTTLCDRVTTKNIDALLTAGGVPSEFDILSVDIDGNDYWIWEAMESHSPRVVVIEYNGSLDPASSLVQPYRPDLPWDRSDCFGASVGAISSLAGRKGYTPIYTDVCGVNLFAVRNDLLGHFADIEPVLDRSSNFSMRGKRHPRGRSGAGYVEV